MIDGKNIILLAFIEMKSVFLRDIRAISREVACLMERETEDLTKKETTFYCSVLCTSLTHLLVWRHDSCKFQACVISFKDLL